VCFRGIFYTSLSLSKNLFLSNLNLTYAELQFRSFEFDSGGTEVPHTCGKIQISSTKKNTQTNPKSLISHRFFNSSIIFEITNSDGAPHLKLILNLDFSTNGIGAPHLLRRVKGAEHRSRL